MMGFIYMAMIGLIAGIITRVLIFSDDVMEWIMAIILGIAGSFIGGIIASLFGLPVNGNWMSLTISVIVTVIVLFAYEFLTQGRYDDYDDYDDYDED